MVRTLFLILFAAAPAWAADLTIAGDAVTPVHGLVKLRAEGVTPGAALLWRVYPPTVAKADTEADRLQFAAAPRSYRVELLEVALADGKVKVREAYRDQTVGTPGVPPPVTPDPTDPPATPAGYFFLAVRPDGPASAEFTRVMSLPAWESLRGKGHKVAEVTAAEAKAIVKLEPPAALPAVVVLSVSADGKASKVVGDPRPFPATADDVAKLPAGLQ